MKRSLLLLLIFSLSFSVACKKDQKENKETPTENTNDVEAIQNSKSEKIVSDKDAKVVVSLDAKSNSNVSGNVVINQQGEIVTLVAVMSGLDEGVHAIHLHETADCSSADGKSTGGHWNPTGQPHGKFGDEAGYHKGDIGNFEANEKGYGTLTFITREWCIGCDDPAKDILGKAIIVHQGSDDFKTQPTGDAGGRISCGGIIQ
jgi:Cu-Zn family superoxide dismutase